MYIFIAQPLQPKQSRGEWRDKVMTASHRTGQICDRGRVICILKRLLPATFWSVFDRSSYFDIFIT